MKKSIKYFLCSFIIINILWTSFMGNVKAYENIDYKNSDKGYISIKSDSKNKDKHKLIIENNNKKYIYDLEKDEKVTKYPLQMGSGNYKVSIWENVEGTKYKNIKNLNFDVKIKDENSVYLNPIFLSDYVNSTKTTEKAKELTKGLNNDEAKIKTIYDFVISNIKYDENKFETLKSDYVPIMDKILSDKSGICYDYSSLFAGMLRSIGIPTKVIKGYATNVKGYHSWNEVYLKNTKQWIIIDTSYDSQARNLNYKYEMIKDNEFYNKTEEY